jgi:hypothetical protein
MTSQPLFATAGGRALKGAAPGGSGLDDIRAVKGLLERVGADRLRQLIDLLAG